MKKQASNRKFEVRTVVEEVTAVYDQLAERPIERSCLARTTCCRFRLTGEVPLITTGEAMVAARAWRATGRKVLPALEDSLGSCPLLDVGTGHCRIYQQRPFPCRTHFCSAAGGPYRRNEVIDLIRKLEEIDCRHGWERGSRPVGDAVSAALALF